MTLHQIRVSRIIDTHDIVKQCIVQLQLGPTKKNVHATLSSPLHPLLLKLQTNLSFLRGVEHNAELQVLLDFTLAVLSKSISVFEGTEAFVSADIELERKETKRCRHESATEDDVSRDSDNLQLLDSRNVNTTWDDILGAREAVASLKQAVVLPVLFPQLFSGPRHPWSCILLYGPPGTGKTMLASAAAFESGVPMFSISASDLLSKWIGDSEKAIRQLFHRASLKDRCIIFFDEIDALCSARGGGNESEASRRVKTEFLVRMQSMDKRRVTIIAATNLPWELDVAFRRRFDRLIYVGFPNFEDRRTLARRKLDDVNHELNDADLDAIAERLDGYTPCDIATILHHAIMRPIAALQNAHWFRSLQKNDEEGTRSVFIPCAPCDEGAFQASMFDLPSQSIEPMAVSVVDVFECISTFPRSVSSEYISQYGKWESSLRQ